MQTYTEFHVTERAISLMYLGHCHQILYKSIAPFKKALIFTALHEIQTRSSEENSVCPFVCLSVCPSVRPSVKRVDCDKTEESSLQIFIPYERLFSLVFWVEGRVAGATSSTRKFRSTGPRWSEIGDFKPIFARSASAVTLSEKSSISTNRKFSNEHKVIIVRSL